MDWSGLLLFDREGKIVPALKEVKVRVVVVDPKRHLFIYFFLLSHRMALP